jgi:hypothetical protein
MAITTMLKGAEAMVVSSWRLAMLSYSSITGRMARKNSMRFDTNGFVDLRIC